MRRPWRALPASALPRSVRARTTAAATVVVAIGFSVAAVLLLQTLHAALSRSQDDTARSRAYDLAVLATDGTLPAELAPAGDDGFIQVLDGSGAVLASTPNVAGRERLVPADAPLGEPAARTVRDVRDDADLEDYRVWSVTTSTPQGPVSVHVANSLELVSETVALVRGILLVGIPLVVALLGLATWVVVGRALRPVAAITAEVADISDADLDRRVPVPPGDDEIARLGRTMNAMLDRLARSSARQRAFAADASHELQSPLARLRTQLEVARAHPAGTNWQGLAPALLADSEEMERLVRDLLFLAQEDERPGAAGVGAVTGGGLVDLDDVVLEEAARVRATGRCEVATARVSAGPVRGSREELGRLVRNLLENAVRHAARRVEVSLSGVGDRVELVVRDDGPGIAPEHRDRVFERFVRLDGARSRDSGGSGLGLSIVAAIAARHGGTVQVEGGRREVDGSGASRWPDGAAFVVRLPAAEVSSP